MIDAAFHPGGSGPAGRGEPRYFAGVFARWLSLACLAAAGAPAAVAGDRPNILWLVAEDTSAANLGCYGDPLAHTPAIDALAARSVIFDRCFTNPVCAPSRFALITGVHAAACGPAHHMRAQGRIPAELVGFPERLRAAGYYTTNNAKTDYNAPIAIDRTWNASGKRAHYGNRPDPHQPFFAVFNHEICHESCLFPEREVDLPFPATDPAAVRIPAYQPDTPEIRADWARHANHLGLLDRQIAGRLAELETAGLADDTIVFFFGDNGGVTPRSKRFLYASGTRVPLVVHVPPRWRHMAPAAAGSRVSDPVSFIDFSATVLALAGVERPALMQGRPFAGPRRTANEYVFCSRDRMDGGYDMSRSVIDRRWLYVRNFRPDLPAVQPLTYMFQARGYQSWARLAREGALTPQTVRFWGRKPPEELYDLDADPDNVHNLAADPALASTLAGRRRALRDHMVAIHDNGLLPEGSPLEGFTESRTGSGFPVERCFDLAVTAAEGAPEGLPRLLAAIDDPSEPIRWWALRGITMLAATHGAAAVDAAARTAVVGRLTDDSPAVRMAAAESLAHVGDLERALPALAEGLRSGSRWTQLQAANVLDQFAAAAGPLRPVMLELLDATRRATEGDPGKSGPDRYVRDRLAHAVGVLDGTIQPLIVPRMP